MSDPRKVNQGAERSAELSLSAALPVTKRCRCERPLLLRERDFYGVRVVCFKCGKRP